MIQLLFMLYKSPPEILDGVIRLTFETMRLIDYNISIEKTT